MRASFKLQFAHHDQPATTWPIWIILWVALGLQTTWLAHFQIGAARLDLPLLCVLTFAMLLGARWGFFLGFIVGLLYGYSVGVSLGSFIISRMIAGGLSGTFEWRFFTNNPLMPPLFAALATLLSYLIFAIMSPSSIAIGQWANAALLSAGLHAVAIWPCLLVARRIILKENPVL